MRYRFRSTTYQITVENPEGKERGVADDDPRWTAL